MYRILAVIGVVFALSSCEPDRAQIAYDVAKENIKLFLNSPTSAAFPDVKDITIYQDGSTWHIQGYLDAQNALGVTLRESFKADVKDISMNGRNNFLSYLELDGKQFYP